MEPGYARVNLHPFVDGRLGHVEGGYRSRAGEIRVGWQVEGENVTLRLSTPVETRLTLPDGTVHMLEAGSYEYSSKIAEPNH